MSIFELLEKARKEAMLNMIVRGGGYKLLNNLRYLPEFKKNFYIMYQEDISNMLSETNTIITKN